MFQWLRERTKPSEVEPNKKVQKAHDLGQEAAKQFHSDLKKAIISMCRS